MAGPMGEKARHAELVAARRVMHQLGLGGLDYFQVSEEMIRRGIPADISNAVILDSMREDTVRLRKAASSHYSFAAATGGFTVLLGIATAAVGGLIWGVAGFAAFGCGLAFRGHQYNRRAVENEAFIEAFQGYTAGQGSA
jgi:hypothetical protein